MEHTIALSNDTALVLFDLLFNYASDNDGRQLSVQYAAERNALWALSAALERVLVEPLQADYAEKLSAARARLEQWGGAWTGDNPSLGGRPSAVVSRTGKRDG